MSPIISEFNNSLIIASTASSWFDILDGFDNVELAGELLENLEKASGSKIITKTSINKNYEYVREIFKRMPGQMKESVEKVFVRLGISLEIKKESDYGYEYERFFSFYTIDELRQYFLDAGLAIVHEDVVPSGKTRWISVIGKKVEK